MPEVLTVVGAEVVAIEAKPPAPVGGASAGSVGDVGR